MGEIQHWPAWYYGPNDQKAVFDHEGEVPDGWVDNPQKLRPGGDRVRTSRRTAEGGTRPVGEGGKLEGNDTGGGDETGGDGGDGGDDETGGTRPAGEGGEVFVLPPFDEVDKPWIIAQLSTRKIPHNPSWGAQRLYDLLKDNLGDKAE